MKKRINSLHLFCSNTYLKRHSSLKDNLFREKQKFLVNQELSPFSACIFFAQLRQKRFHSRYNFGYGILLYIRKMPHFSPLTAHFGGFEGVFSFINDKSAILCPTKTETADLVSFKGSIVQGMILLDKLEFVFNCNTCRCHHSPQ